MTTIRPKAAAVNRLERRQFRKLCKIRRDSPAYRAADDPEYEKILARWSATLELLDLPLQTRKAAAR